MGVIRRHMKKEWSDVYFGKNYHVTQNEEHFTFTADDGDVIEFDWYYGEGGQVVENVKGTDKHTACNLTYILWMQV